MSYFLATHVTRDVGYDPGLTEEAIGSLYPNMGGFFAWLRVHFEINFIIIARGKRFRETFYGVREALQGIPFKYSSFPGDEVSMHKKGNKWYATIDEKMDDISKEEYEAWEDIHELAWPYIKLHIEGTLFFAGRQLMSGLGFKHMTKSASIYLLDAQNESAQFIVNEGRLDQTMLKTIA